MSKRGKLHYSGAICYATNRTTAHVVAGYAACCSGDQAKKIRKAGLNRVDPAEVTCKRCLAILAKRVNCAAHPESCCG